MKNNQSDVLKATADKKVVKKAETKSTAKKPTEKKPNRAIKFIKDLRAEVKKIVWPTKKQVINNTSVVIVAMLASGAFIWAIDSLFKVLFDLMLKR